MFVHNTQLHIWKKIRAQGGREVMIFGLFCSHRTWAPCSYWADHEPKYSVVTCEAICLLKLWGNLVMQQWPTHSLNLSKIEMVWLDLMRAVHKRMPANLNELKKYCKDECAKIPPQCERLITSVLFRQYSKQLLQGVAKQTVQEHKDIFWPSIVGLYVETLALTTHLLQRFPESLC